MKDIEIEIQVRVSSTKALLKFLKKNATLTQESHQIDQYLTPPDHNFTDTRPVAEWLRLRDANGKFSITYKNWHYEKGGRSTHADEYETPVKDLDQLRKIFTALKFKPVITVNKHRASWQYQDYEVSLDAVEGLGNFVEVEYKGKDAIIDPKTITTSMIQFLKDHGCGTIERNYVGYPFLLLNPDEAKFEEV